LIDIVDEGGEGGVAGARLAHSVDGDVVKNGGKFCGGKRSERAT
jgi:hypothetical protein